MAKTYLERIHETQKEIDKLTAEYEAIEAAYNATVSTYKLRMGDPRMIALQTQVNEEFSVINDQLDKLKHDLKYWIGCYEKSLEVILEDYQSPLDTERILDRVTRNGYITVIKF